MNKPFILIDGSSYLYRAFYALPALTNSKGQPTGAIFGVINMIRKLIKDYEPEKIAVVFDAKGKTFRDDLFTAYKATRTPMPHDLTLQIEPLKAIVTAMGLPLLIIDGVEADDVIATLAIQAEKNKLHTLISTGDKDMAQIVNDNITLINTMSNTLLNPQGVIEKFGVPPELIVDYLALTGDKSDNIPGIPNVGPKTAVKWLNEFGNLDNIIKQADTITGKVGENLRAHLSDLELSRQLATVKTDVTLLQSPQDLSPAAANYEKLIELYTHLEFKSLLNEILEKNKAATNTQTHYEAIITESDLNKWLQQLSKNNDLTIDVKTSAPNSRTTEIVGIALAIHPDTAAYIPLAHEDIEAPHLLSREYVLKKLKPHLENSELKKISQNLKFVKEVLANHDIHLSGIAFDTMLSSYVLNSSAARHDLDTLALKYLGLQLTTYEDIAGKGAKQIPFNQVNVTSATSYAAGEADATTKIHDILQPKITAEPGLKYVFEEIEMPLLSVLAKMEQHGVLIDADKLKQQSKEITKRLKELEKEAFTSAGMEFNLSSPKQLQEILFEKQQLPVLQKTPTGQASTAEAVLQELALDYPLPNIILEFRSLAKLKSTYADALPNQINAKTGRVHTSYNQAVAATGRLSSVDPNLQNIPIRTPEGRRIRQAFIAPKGKKIVSADYSQIELRIMAHLSKDPGLLTAFSEGSDIHRATAAEVFNTPLDKVTADQRRNAKAINFGLIYGMSSFGLSRQLGIDTRIAQEYMDLYFHRYPNVKHYMETTRELAHKQGFVETIYGRRLYLPEINATNLQRRRAAERAAINAPMQGSAADIIKLAMIHMDAYLQQHRIDAQMIMQVHDELVFEVAENEIESFLKQLEKHMCHPAKLDAPLVIGIGIGDNWDEAH